MRSAPTRHRRVFVLLLAAYLLALAPIALWPSPIDADASAFLTRGLNALHRYGLPGLVDYNLVEVMSNVALFVPLGFLLGGALPLNIKWIALPVGMCGSVVIEVSHLLIQPERLASLQDVLANSLGAAVGTVLAYAIALRKTGRNDPDPLARPLPNPQSRPGPYA